MKKRTIELVVFIVIALLIVGIGIKLFFNPVSGIPNISFSNYRYENSDKYTQASSGSSRNVSSLEIDWVSGLVEIVSYNGKEIAFEEKSTNEISSNERMCYWNDGDTLRIKYTSSGFFNLIDKHKTLTVYVPSNVKLNKLELDVVSADVSIFGLSTDDTEYDSVSGNLFADNFSCNFFEGESVSGEVSLIISSLTQPREIEIDTVSGDVNLSIPKDFGYDISFDTVSGDITCKTESVSISKNRIKHGDASLNIDIDTVSGDLVIE